MIASDVFRDQPTLEGTQVRLEPQGSRHFEGLWPLGTDPEVRKLTGTTQERDCSATPYTGKANGSTAS